MNTKEIIKNLMETSIWDKDEEENIFLKEAFMDFPQGTYYDSIMEKFKKNEDYEAVMKEADFVDDKSIDDLEKDEKNELVHEGKYGDVMETPDGQYEVYDKLGMLVTTLGNIDEAIEMVDSGEPNADVPKWEKKTDNEDDTFFDELNKGGIRKENIFDNPQVDASKKIKIMGKYKNITTEELDNAENSEEADYLVAEYKKNLGSEWEVWKESKKMKEEQYLAFNDKPDEKFAKDIAKTIGDYYKNTGELVKSITLDAVEIVDGEVKARGIKVDYDEASAVETPMPEAPAEENTDETTPEGETPETNTEPPSHEPETEETKTESESIYKTVLEALESGKTIDEVKTEIKEAKEIIEQLLLEDEKSLIDAINSAFNSSKTLQANKGKILKDFKEWFHKQPLGENYDFNKFISEFVKIDVADDKTAINNIFSKLKPNIILLSKNIIAKNMKKDELNRVFDLFIDKIAI